MKQLALNVMLSLLMITCKGQADNINTKIKKDTMEYLKIEDFKKGNYTDDNGDFIQQFKTTSTDADYIQNIRLKNSPITIIKMFHEKTKSIRVRGQRFYNFIYGVWKEYDENGNLIKETDHNKNYPFKVEELCKLIKQEYGIDLMVKSDPNKDELQYRVDRRYEASTKQHLYLVVFSYGYSDEGEPGFPVKGVYINGTNGKILYEDAQFLERPNGNKIPNSKTKFPQKSEVENQKRSTSLLATPEEKGTSQKSELGIAYTSQSEIKADKNIYQVYEGKYYTKAEWEEFKKSLPWVDRLFLGKS